MGELNVENVVTDLVSWCKGWYHYRRNYLSLRYRHNLPPDLATINAVGGMMRDEETQLLYDLARQAQGGCIVEIGSYHGRSTVALAIGTRAGQRVRVYAIDPFVPFTGPAGGKYGALDRVLFIRNLLLAGVGELVWPIHLTAEQASKGWSEPISLLWIDGDHTYPAARADFDNWAPYVLPGGIVAFHDSTREDLGPKRVVAEVLATGAYEKLGLVSSLTYLRKRGAEAPLPDPPAAA
jgi:predicted O-methyltransferase YrrM